MDPLKIRLFEELAMNAWPSLQTVLHDGWVLRFAGGYTRRSNAAHPLYPGGLPLEEKIRACEELYRARGLPVTFKLTPTSEPAGLDEALEARGYRLDAPTCVQVMPLSGQAFSIPAGVEVAPTPSEAWRSAFARFSGATPERQAMHERILAEILPAAAYAAVWQGGEIAACGLGVEQNGYIGFFDIVTGAEFRRRGFGKQVMESLLAWGMGRGAHTAYLQVMKDNAPALALYAGLGFREAYGYWYRVKE